MESAAEISSNVDNAGAPDETIPNGTHHPRPNILVNLASAATILDLGSRILGIVLSVLALASIHKDTLKSDHHTSNASCNHVRFLLSASPDASISRNTSESGQIVSDAMRSEAESPPPEVGDQDDSRPKVQRQGSQSSDPRSLNWEGTRSSRSAAAHPSMAGNGGSGTPHNSKLARTPSELDKRYGMLILDEGGYPGRECCEPRGYYPNALGKRRRDVQCVHNRHVAGYPKHFCPCEASSARRKWDAREDWAPSVSRLEKSGYERRDYLTELGKIKRERWQGCGF